MFTVCRYRHAPRPGSSLWPRQSGIYFGSYWGTLILVAGILIIYEAVSNLFGSSHVINKLDYGIYLSRHCYHQLCRRNGFVNTGKKNNSLALIASGKHLQSDTYTTAGIIAGLVLLYFTNLGWIDSAVAILFAVIILIYRLQDHT